MAAGAGARMRFFENKMPDCGYDQEVQIPVDQIRARIVAVIEALRQNVVASPQACDGGVYVGIAGIAYALLYVAQSKQIPEKESEYLELAEQYINVALDYEEKKQSPEMRSAFLLGSAGVFAVAALLYRALGKEEKVQEYIGKYASLAGLCCQPGDYLGCGSDEVLVGRAGFLCGAEMLTKKLGQQVLSDEVTFAICRAMVDSGRSYSQRHKSQSPLMYAYYNTEYLGAAHGLSGIVQMLLNYPTFVKSDPTIELDLRRTVDYLVSCRSGDYNVPPTVAECAQQRPPEHQLVHWCHGAPGIIYLFAKAFLLWKDPMHLIASRKCADLTWQKGLLRKGPGICHGISGNGYVFLLTYRLTGDCKFIHRALQFSEFMQTEEFVKGARCPDAPFSLFEGWAGAVCFLTDLLQPHNAEFPFFDVF